MLVDDFLIPGILCSKTFFAWPAEEKSRTEINIEVLAQSVERKWGRKELAPRDEKDLKSEEREIIGI